MSEAFAFNARNVEPAKPRDNTLIPSGWHRAWVIGAEMKKNAAGNGRYLELTWQIVEGEAENRRHWERYNVENPSEVAVRIAQEQLSAVMHAINVLEFNDPGELSGVMCMIKIGIEKGKNGNPDRNKIYGYLPDGDPKATVMVPKTGAGAKGAVSGARATALNDKEDDLPF